MGRVLVCVFVQFVDFLTKEAGPESSGPGFGRPVVSAKGQRVNQVEVGMAVRLSFSVV